MGFNSGFKGLIYIYIYIYIFTLLVTVLFLLHRKCAYIWTRINKTNHSQNKQSNILCTIYNAYQLYHFISLYQAPWLSLILNRNMKENKTDNFIHWMHISLVINRILKLRWTLRYTSNMRKSARGLNPNYRHLIKQTPCGDIRLQQTCCKRLCSAYADIKYA